MLAMAVAPAPSMGRKELLVLCVTQLGLLLVKEGGQNQADNHKWVPSRIPLCSCWGDWETYWVRGNS